MQQISQSQWKVLSHNVFDCFTWAEKNGGKNTCSKLKLFYCIQKPNDWKSNCWASEKHSRLIRKLNHMKQKFSYAETYGLQISRDVKKLNSIIENYFKTEPKLVHHDGHKKSSVRNYLITCHD